MNTALLHAMREQAQALDALRFAGRVAYTYNPLHYAWAIHEQYVKRFGDNPKKVVFLGMNPGPFGMAQTGIPFGEISAVRDWMGLTGKVLHPEHEHPKRPVLGLDCPRTEVSGKRLWGLFRERFGTADAFFKEHYVLNYCSLVFMESSGKNLTPEQLPVGEKKQLCNVCDPMLLDALKALEPTWVVAVGTFVYQRLQPLIETGGYRLALITHPSPANPRAAHNWGGLVTQQLQQQGVW